MPITSLRLTLADQLASAGTSPEDKERQTVLPPVTGRVVNQAGRRALIRQMVLQAPCHFSTKTTEREYEYNGRTDGHA